MLKFKASLAFFLLLCSVASAQFPDLGGIGTSITSGGRGGGSQSEYVFDPDTFGVFYFYADNPNEEIPFLDSLLDNFQQYDPIRLRDFEYGNLGNVGSAHYQLFYEPIFRRGYDIGFHQYDLYQSHSGNTPYYRIKKNAFTRAYYSQQGQENHSFKGEYSRNFANGINLSLDYRRMKHDGQYVTQVNSINAFAGSVWYHAKGGRYDGYFSFNSNSIKEQDNGGVDI
ncbi:MAG: putative porin, partial [Bacteroidota bacterium]